MIITVIRTIILYIVIIITVRIMGKRQISELQTSELVVTLLMSDIASIPMQNTDQSLLSGIIPIFVLVIFEILISFLMLKHSKFRSLICGRPVIIIDHGRIDQKAMKELRMSTEDLFEELRQKDIFHPSDVDFAIVETNGKLSIMKKSECESVTVKQIGAKGDRRGLEAVIVSDGEIAESSMKFCGISRSWLRSILDLEGVRLSDIFIMTADQGRRYTIIKKENRQCTE